MVPSSWIFTNRQYVSLNYYNKKIRKIKSVKIQKEQGESELDRGWMEAKALINDNFLLFKSLKEISTMKRIL